MQILFISALKISIITEQGNFGSFLTFENGLNIIRAENSHGKSSLLNSILYCLGLEILLGRKGVESIKPALKNQLEHDGEEIAVLESFVELEIANAKDEYIVIRRHIKGEADDRLVQINTGCFLSAPSSSKGTDEFFFLRDAGAAQRQKGFHFFLAEFLAIAQPKVLKFDGKEAPLYLECIFPLFFIEQIRGWSGIQATVPTVFGIKNVKKRALEYVLNLNVADLQRERQELTDLKKELKNDWNTARNRIDDMATSASGVIRNLPAKPTADKNSATFNTELLFDGDWLTIDNWMVHQRSIITSKKEQIEKKPSLDSDVAKELEEAETALMFETASLAEARAAYFEEQENIRNLEERILFLDEDLFKNNDALRLQKYGASHNLLSLQGECPTCHQAISDVLLKQSTPVMSIEENIAFLKQQKKTAQVLLAASQKKLITIEQEYLVREKQTVRTRQKIRDLKKDLISPQGTPSLADTRELVLLEEQLRQTIAVRDKLNDEEENLGELADQWKNILAREKKLPSESLSKKDDCKLKELRDIFKELIADFGYNSSAINTVKLSLDTYHPTIEGFEIAYDASASDHIRVIWAFTIALLRLTLKQQINHFGVLFFDEPGQQEMRDLSSKSFYNHISKLPDDRCQIIVATSKNRTRLDDILAGVEVNIHEFGDKFTLMPM